MSDDDYGLSLKNNPRASPAAATMASSKISEQSPAHWRPWDSVESQEAEPSAPQSRAFRRERRPDSSASGEPILIASPELVPLHHTHTIVVEPHHGHHHADCDAAPSRDSAAGAGPQYYAHGGGYGRQQGPWSPPRRGHPNYHHPGAHYHHHDAPTTTGTYARTTDGAAASRDAALWGASSSSEGPPAGAPPRMWHALPPMKTAPPFAQKQQGQVPGNRGAYSNFPPDATSNPHAATRESLVRMMWSSSSSTNISTGAETRERAPDAQQAPAPTGSGGAPQQRPPFTWGPQPRANTQQPAGFGPAASLPPPTSAISTTRGHQLVFRGNSVTGGGQQQQQQYGAYESPSYVRSASMVDIQHGEQSERGRPQSASSPPLPPVRGHEPGATRRTYSVPGIRAGMYEGAAPASEYDTSRQSSGDSERAGYADPSRAQPPPPQQQQPHRRPEMLRPHSIPTASAAGGQFSAPVWRRQLSYSPAAAMEQSPTMSQTGDMVEGTRSWEPSYSTQHSPNIASLSLESQLSTSSFAAAPALAGGRVSQFPRRDSSLFAASAGGPASAGTSPRQQFAGFTAATPMPMTPVMEASEPQHQVHEERDMGDAASPPLGASAAGGPPGSGHVSSRRKKPPIYRADRPCSHCGVLESCTWRPGPQGSGSLCNTCGYYYRRHGRLNMKRKHLMAAKRSEPVDAYDAHGHGSTGSFRRVNSL